MNERGTPRSRGGFERSSSPKAPGHFDLDRLVTEVLIPEREREEPEAGAALRVEWEALKEQWR